MSGNTPFGFTPGDPDDGKQFDMSQLGSALESIGRMMQSGGSSGPVNWELAVQVARQTEAQKQDNGVTDSERSAVDDGVRLANLWLGESETFPPNTTAAIAWSRGDWVGSTIPAWQRIITPVAEHVQGTLSGMLGGQGLADLKGIPGMEGMADQVDMEQLQQMLGPLTGMAQQMGAAMFGSQVGQGIGRLSGEVLCSSDIGVPLTPDGRPTLVPRNISEFADGIDVPRQDVLLYVALRECAHQRLFTHVPWLRSRLEEAVESYARGITVDTATIEEAVRDIDPTNPASLQGALSSGIFTPKDTPDQNAALNRLETLLALIEGWVDHVVNDAVDDRMPTISRLNEAMRRRRAAGGPAEKTFANLVGLQMRPRRLREAVVFWRRVAEDRGAAARDSLWEHPDLLPTASDLDDVAGFLERWNAIGELEAELADVGRQHREAASAQDPADGAADDSTAAGQTDDPSAENSAPGTRDSDGDASRGPSNDDEDPGPAAGS